MQLTELVTYCVETVF